jgi:hypothetical protein
MRTIFISLAFLCLNANADVFFSTTGDSVVFVKDQYDYDNIRCELCFYKYSESRNEMKLYKKIKFLTTEEKYDSIIGKYLNKYHFQKEGEYIEDTSGFVSVAYRKHKFRFLKMQKGPCSKGCWKHMYYYLNADVSVSTEGYLLWMRKSVNLVYVESLYLEWGATPEEEFKFDPRRAVRTSVVKMPGRKKYFILVTYHPGRKSKHVLERPAYKCFLVKRNLMTQ